MTSAFVYLLRCRDGSLYCGWSSDPERRLAEHAAGQASRYTRARLPVELVWVRECRDRSEAMREEARIKRLPAATKRALVLSGTAPATSDRGSPRRAAASPRG